MQNGRQSWRYKFTNILYTDEQTDTRMDRQTYHQMGRRTERQSDFENIRSLGYGGKHRTDYTNQTKYAPFCIQDVILKYADKRIKSVPCFVNVIRSFFISRIWRRDQIADDLYPAVKFPDVFRRNSRRESIEWTYKLFQESQKNFYPFTRWQKSSFVGWQRST